MRKTRIFVLATAAHLFATVGALLAAVSFGFAEFDGHSPHPLAQPAAFVFSVLQWPLLSLWEDSTTLNQILPGLLGYIPFAANSALWGAVAVAIASVAATLKHRGGKSRAA